METGGYVPKHLHGSEAPARRPRRPWGVACLVAGLALVAVAQGLGPLGSRRPTDPALAAGPSGALAGSNPSVCVRASLEDRAGLVLVIGLPGVTRPDDPLVDAAAEAGVAGVMLRDDNIVSEPQVQALVTGLRARLGDHLLVAVDDEGGRVSSMGALGEHLRTARRLGQRGADAAHDAGLELGRLAASVGIDWVLAPVADLDGGPAGDVIGDRSFGEEPAEVAADAAAFADGLHEAGVAATAKHFPGHGGDGDPHTGRTVDPATSADLAATDLVPFRRLIADGVEVTMVGHATYPAIWGDTPASLASGAYDLLRAQGFDGVALTDALGMGAIHAEHGFDAAPALAIGAGADAVLVTQGDQVGVLRDGLVTAVRDGRLDEDRLDVAVGRVLALRGQDPHGIVCTDVAR